MCCDDTESTPRTKIHPETHPIDFHVDCSAIMMWGISFSKKKFLRLAWFLLPPCAHFHASSLEHDACFLYKILDVVGGSSSMGESETSAPEWQPPATIETLFNATAGNKFAGLNRPVAGALSDDSLELGSAPLQLYSLATPNGQKVGILLEELGVSHPTCRWDLCSN